MAKRARRRGDNRGDTVPLTDWITDESSLLKRIERALAELETEEYRRYIRDGLPLTSDYNRSIPVEEVAARAGVSPQRILQLVEKHRKHGRIKFKRLRCKTRSRYGWCLRHDRYEDGVALVEPRLVKLVDELWRIRKKLWDCMTGHVYLHIQGKIYVYRPVICGLTREEIIELVARAAIIGEELGIPEDRLREWLKLNQDRNVFYLDNGEKVVLESVGD